MSKNINQERERERKKTEEVQHLNDKDFQKGRTEKTEGMIHQGDFPELI